MKTSKLKGKIYRYELIQDGQVVASVESSDNAVAIGEIALYALMYGQDGPVEIKEVSK